ncbi:hypothetical protein [Streptomyces anthocyanicus]|uniref:hypothetical protein n=1 Tax=Streptomyces anthocyanicus TaxID=68174 RepID=UPI002F91427D|nr:hypothetical protein OH747_41045 [Streptomyces anthocyanicus]
MTDRLGVLTQSTEFNGIDFVEIADDAQTSLLVHFLNTVPVAGTLSGPSPVRITGEAGVPPVDVLPVADPADWSTDDLGRPLLRVRTAVPGGFTTYRLRIASGVLDSYYAEVPFSFKARCPSDLDCGCAPRPCPAEAETSPAVDYLAKDFLSFKQALLEYSATAYPQWVQRSEADLGMTLLELLAAAGDDLSHLQDRIAAEGSAVTATQRRSVVRHARLVDYEPRPATSARTLIQADVASGPLPAGTLLSASGPGDRPIWFELGAGMIDPATGGFTDTPLTVDPRWNAHHRCDDSCPQGCARRWRILPYWWDDADRCLPAGATCLWIRGHGFGFRDGDPATGGPGPALLIDTEGEGPLDPPVREVVHLTEAVELTDPLFNEKVTRISWPAQEALTRDHDLTRTHLAGNLVPATEGRRYTERFVIGPHHGSAAPAGALPAVARVGPNASCTDPRPVHSHTLSRGRLAWLTDPAREAPGPEERPLPEIHLRELPQDGGTQRSWVWRRSLLDAARFERAFTVEPVRYTDLRTGADRLTGVPRWEYDGDDADTVRLGDGVFGERPATGTVFEVTYRVSDGARGALAAETVTGIDPAMEGLLLSAANPFPTVGAAEAESLEKVRRNAPYAFRSRQLRAVRPEDYDAAAEELDWVLDAGTAFRWTGSWLTVFTTPQPRRTALAGTAERAGLLSLLNRRRTAGYEVHVQQPRYAPLDLVVTVCAQPWAFRGEVVAAVLTELGTGRRADGQPAFFAHGRFRFGAPLERSTVEAAVQRAAGVRGVVSILHRRRGLVDTFEPMPETVAVGREEIVRVDNDPRSPQNGSLRIVVEGGK